MALLPTLTVPLRDLAPLVASLPFSLDDAEAAGRAFADGRAGDARAREHAALWAYAWAVRYMTRKFATERSGGPSDFDALLTRAQEGIWKADERLDDPLKFPHYVSRVCKNALLTHRERRRTTVEADDTTLAPVFDDEVSGDDRSAIRRDVADAISGLPAAVCVVARMLLLDRLDFEAVAAATGHPVATVRTYASKANARLRASPALRAHHYDDVLPPGALGPDG